RHANWFGKTSVSQAEQSSGCKRVRPNMCYQTASAHSWAAAGERWPLGSMMQEPAHWKDLPAAFGDRVRIRAAAETLAAGMAGRTGVVFGITTVSVSGVELVGTPTEDTACNQCLFR